jgi:hypothetical protein
MRSDHVLAVLAELEAAGVAAWIDGGWGIDALLGRQTRPHDDLDLVVAADAVPACRMVLAAGGFALDGVQPHLGYEPDDQDRADMTKLARHFGIELPAPYAVTR